MLKFIALLLALLSVALWAGRGATSEGFPGALTAYWRAHEDEYMKTETATFAAGCFWGVEAAFRRLDGVISTAVGYTGGHHPEPSYRDVCSGKTGHAEAVRVEYDPRAVSYERLLEAFWQMPQPSRAAQGHYGGQYRSALFYHTEEQRKAAEAKKRELEEWREAELSTQIVPAGKFWPAEECHQQYEEKLKSGSVSCPLP